MIMVLKSIITVACVTFLLIGTSASAETFSLEHMDDDVIGKPRLTFAGQDDTLFDIARRHDLGITELELANPGMSVWLPDVHQAIDLPTHFVLPNSQRDGIVLNLPEFRLYQFSTDLVSDIQSVATYPISIGQKHWQTPLGQSFIVGKKEHPNWFPPESIREEAWLAGRFLPHVVPTGPTNPLGDHALYLDMPTYLIHGTNKPTGVGMRVTHGCMDALAAMGGTPFDVNNPVVFPENYNVFIPSTTGVDLNLRSDENPSGPTCRFPMFEGLDPAGNPVDYIITEASDPAVAEMLGVIFSPRMAAAAFGPGAQQVTLENGIMRFPGTVDFSFTRSVTPGDANATEGINSITRSVFPPAAVQPGAIADDEWSSLVTLPSGQTLNAQMVANATGVHDRIPDSAQDDQNNPNLDRVNRFVVLQLLDGWQGDEQFYFHLVTDASAAVPASIELGVFAPRVGLIGSAGIFPEEARLGFSPTVNGVFESENGFQGLNVAATDQQNDPTNTFPIDPTDTRYSPMWDVHLNMWTSEAIDNDERRVITSIEDLEGLIDQGLITNFAGNDGPENDFIAGLMPTGAIINCPVVMQPQSAAIGTTFGVFEN